VRPAEIPELQLVWPAAEHLDGYRAALARGWSPDNVRDEDAAREEIEQIDRDPEAFVRSQVDREARNGPVVLPDGSRVPRIPGYRRWLWDGEFAGVIGFRWQPGSTQLPPYCLGHIGFAVVPWKRGRGYAKRALELLLPDTRNEGLDYVELTTDTWNHASQRVIEANGGILVERSVLPVWYGKGELLRFRIHL
jgi:predicted acetyltransferase